MHSTTSAHHHPSRAAVTFLSLQLTNSCASTISAWKGKSLGPGAAALWGVGRSQASSTLGSLCGTDPTEPTTWCLPSVVEICHTTGAAPANANGGREGREGTPGAEKLSSAQLTCRNPANAADIGQLRPGLRGVGHTGQTRAI